MEQIAPVEVAKVPCPFCGVQIDSTAIFCPQCGKKVREQAISTSLGAQALVYGLSFFLPPFNLALTARYLKSSDPVAKKIGWISVILMLVSLIIVGWSTYVFTRNLSDQVDQQMKVYQNMGF